jgi:hypothetical protein
MQRFLAVVGIGTAVLFAVISFGFIDPHLSLPFAPGSRPIEELLRFMVYRRSIDVSLFYAGALLIWYAAYANSLRSAMKGNIRKIPGWLVVIIGIALLSFPALSYDIFNYIATAKVTYQYKENPYVVMPIEIPNEPMLSFTRAANKLALYGPVWIALTGIPHVLGNSHIFLGIFSFKLFAGVSYAIICWLIFQKTKRWDQVLFFAANPLVIIELLVNGHNDGMMMALALAALLLADKKGVWINIGAVLLLLASVLIKGATIVLLPLFFIPKLSVEKKYLFAFFGMVGVFLLSPLREEMYPWYAVWFISIAACIPRTKNSILHDLVVWASLGLMARYIPWIATREYGGITPVTRVILTAVPLIIYGLTTIFRTRFYPKKRR